MTVSSDYRELTPTVNRVNLMKRVTMNSSALGGPSDSIRAGRRLAQAALVLALLSQCTVAEESVETSPERGFFPGRTYAISEIENIDVIAGNVNLNIPITSLPPGRAGMSAGVSLLYNSQIYDIRLDYSKTKEYMGDPLNPVPALTQNLEISPRGGWHYGYNSGLELEVRPTEGAFADCTLEPATQNMEVFKLRVFLPDGSRHLLHLRGYTAHSWDGYYEISPSGHHSP